MRTARISLWPTRRRAEWMLDQLLSFMKVDPGRFAMTQDADEYMSVIEGLVADIKRAIICECDRCALKSCPCKQARGKTIALLSAGSLVGLP